MLEFFITYIIICVIIIFLYIKKDNIFSLEEYLNFKKTLIKLIAIEVSLLLFFIIILVTPN